MKRKEQEDSFYQRLSDGFSVNVLLLGSSQPDAASKLRSQFSSSLAEDYHVNSHITDIVPAETPYETYTHCHQTFQTTTPSEAGDFHLAILDYSISEQELPAYEALLAFLHERFPYCTFISLSKAQDSLAGIQSTLDRISAAYSCDIPEDDTDPYTALMHLIKKQTSSYTSIPTLHPKLVIPASNGFKQLHYLSCKSDLIRITDSSWEYTPVESETSGPQNFLIGIDYSTLPGNTVVQLFLDGRPSSQLSEVKAEPDTSSRISMLGEGSFQQSIVLQFEDAAHADQLQGIILSGAIGFQNNTIFFPFESDSIDSMNTEKTKIDENDSEDNTQEPRKPTRIHLQTQPKSPETQSTESLVSASESTQVYENSSTSNTSVDSSTTVVSPSDPTETETSAPYIYNQKAGSGVDPAIIEKYRLLQEGTANP